MRMRAVGPSIFCKAATKEAAHSSGSAGRMTSRLGMSLRELICSMGWWVGPSSPTATESWVKMKKTGSWERAARRMAGRM